MTKDDFGTTNLELHDFLSRKSMKECTDAVVGDFFNHIMPEQDCWTEDEKESHRQLLKQTLKALDLPVLLKDEEGNILGLYPERVPGPEIRSLQSIPTTKIRFVLEDVLDRDRSNESKAAENLERRRQERKATKN